MSARFDELWTDFMEGELDAAGMSELRELLAQDEALRRRAADLYQTHRLLGLAHGRAAESAEAFVRATVARLPVDADAFTAKIVSRIAVAKPDKKAARLAWPRYGLAAAVAVGATLAIQALFVPKRATQTAAAAPQNYVATLVRADGAQWTGGAPREGQRLVPGKLRLASGSAMLQFDSGATAILTGPAELALDSATTATLRVGRVTVRAEDEAFGFTLRTPSSDVVDLGTEFAVSVESGGASEVHVLEGLVEATARNGTPDDAHLISDGKALRFAGGGKDAPVEVPMLARPFAEVLPPPVPRAETPGRVLAYDGFDYAAEMKSGTPDGGEGWSGGWVRGGFGVRDAVLRFLPEPSLRGPDALSRTATGGQMLFDGGDFTVYKRKLAEPLDLRIDSVRYVSFLVRKTAPRDAEAGDEWMRVIWTTRAAKAERCGFGVLGNNRPFVFSQGVPNVAAAEPIAPEQTYLFVGKLVTGRDTPDEIFLKIFGPRDALDLREPKRWTVAGKSNRLDARLDELHLGFGPHGGFAFDELRIGTTWESVVPANR